MVNCANCKRSFKSRLGKGKDSRCENCANIWRELQLREDNEGRKERHRELDMIEKELEIKQKQLEMERQKVTIKEMFPNGGTVELTCYYDDSMQEKVRSLMKGAYLALPMSSPETTSSACSRDQVTEKAPRDYSSPYRPRDTANDLDDLTSYRRVHFEPEKYRSSELRKFSATENKELSDFRKPRKLPSVDGLRSRIASRHKLEDEGSSFGSGGSAD